MSRIGNKLITVPAGVTIDVAPGNEVTVKGPKGTLTRKFADNLEISIDGNEVRVVRPNDEKRTKQLHGTTRALLHNMIVGVSEGFKKELELVGIGFRTEAKNGKLVMQVGYSHPVEMEIEDGLEVKCPSATTIEVSGIDKQQVGQYAAEIRNKRKPEPYKGKGIRYKGENIRRKEGKTAGKK